MHEVISHNQAIDLFTKGDLHDIRMYPETGKTIFVYKGLEYIGNVHGYVLKDKEQNMFASRKEEDGQHRLCIRRGRVIKGTMVNGVGKLITFRNAKVAKECADELNEKFFEEYDTYMDRDNNPRQPGVHVPAELRDGMVSTIMKYATLEDEVVSPTVQG